MRNAVFTIVAKNYIGLAQVLEKSVQKNADADFYIFVADEEDSMSMESLPPNVIFCKRKLAIESRKWIELSFKYNLVEFCTAIKPCCFGFLFDKTEYSKVIYLDPDVYVFNSLNPLFNDLDKYSIILTPHIVDMQTPFKGVYPDYLFLVNGTFNLGFIGLNNSKESRNMLAWWEDRLNDQCFFDNDRGMATDQKWINLLPAFLGPEVLHISSGKGLNVAPWNYHERKIIIKEDRLFVTDRIADSSLVTPLVFVHFSGYDYRAFAKNNFAHKSENENVYPDLNFIFERYAEALKNDSFVRYIGLKYSYSQFKNGKNIISLHRRIYRRLLSEGYNFPDPFDTGRSSFYEGLKKRKLVDNSVSSADTVTNKTIPSFGKKMALVNLLFRGLQRIAGVRKYSIFIRFFRRYFKEENQAFLFTKDVKEKLW